MKNLWKKWCEDGIRWPYLHDPVSKKPSITLLFPYITFVAAMISLILLHFWPSLILATTTSIVMWFAATIFYMMRKLSKAKFDLNSKSFELDSGDALADPEVPNDPSPDDLTGG